MGDRTLVGYIVRGGDGKRTAVFGYAWPKNLNRGDELIVKHFAPTTDGRDRARLMALAVGGTVKRVMKRAPTSCESTRKEAE